MRVATFNVRHGLGNDGIVDLERTAAVIRATGADFVALQEVDHMLERSGLTDQTTRLAELTGLACEFWPTLERRQGRYGLAFASAWKCASRYQPLPRLGQREPRGAVICRCERVCIVTTHLSRDADERRAQTRALGQLVAGLEGPVVLAGDLNQGARGLAPLRAAGLSVASRRHQTLVGARRGQIDHVLVGGGAHIRRSWTLPCDASDHLPLVAEIGLP